jgi:hypothetical protein
LIHLKDLSARTERKLRFDLIPHEAMQGIALGFTIGAEKHAPNGWQTGGDRAHYYGAILRHANAWLAGQEFDTDGKHHMDGVMCSAAILRAMCARGIASRRRSIARGPNDPVHQTGTSGAFGVHPLQRERQ